MLHFEQNGVQELTNDEIKLLVTNKYIPSYKLEGMLGDLEKGVSIRREMLKKKLPNPDSLELLPFEDYDYSYVSSNLIIHKCSSVIFLSKPVIEIHRKDVCTCKKLH